MNDWHNPIDGCGHCGKRIRYQPFAEFCSADCFNAHNSDVRTDLLDEIDELKAKIAELENTVAMYRDKLETGQLAFSLR